MYIACARIFSKTDVIWTSHFAFNMKLNLTNTNFIPEMKYHPLRQENAFAFFLLHRVYVETSHREPAGVPLIDWPESTDTSPRRHSPTKRNLCQEKTDEAIYRFIKSSSPVDSFHLASFTAFGFNRHGLPGHARYFSSNDGRRKQIAPINYNQQVRRISCRRAHGNGGQLAVPTKRSWEIVALEGLRPSWVHTGTLDYNDEKL